MKKYFYYLIVVFLGSQVFEGCATSWPFTSAREQYGEVFFSKNLITEGDNYKPIGLGSNSFEQGEGIIYLYPLTKGGEYYNLKILDSNNNIVYSTNDYLKENYCQWIILSKTQVNYFKGQYTVDVAFNQSGKTFEKHFGILDNPANMGNNTLPSDDFYMSSFTETKGGSNPQKRDSFSKSEVPEVIIMGYKSKLVNIKVYSISANKLVNENNTYVPEQSNTYMHIPFQNLTPDSYKVDCSIEGIVVKTLFFTIFN